MGALVAASLLPLGLPAAPAAPVVPPVCGCAAECTWVTYTRDLAPDCNDGTWTFCANPNPPPTGKNCCDHLHTVATYQEAVQTPENTCKKFGSHVQRFRKHEAQYCETDGSGQLTGNCAVMGAPVDCTHTYYRDTLAVCPQQVP